MVSVCKHFWGYAPIGPETMNLKLSVILMSAFAAACANAAVTDFTVNGTKVTAAQQEQILKNLTARGQQRTPQLENAVKQNLVTEIAVLQEAQKAGLANDPNVKIAVQNATNNIMTEALLNRYVQQHPTSDADLQKMYQKDKAAYGNTEYHLRQIVTKTQGEAQNALNRVLKGENFAKVASAVTIDQPSKDRGGDIGWFAPVRVVPQIGQLLPSLKAGQIYSKPVQFRGGWAVFQVVATRPAQLFPTFEQAKPQLQRIAAAQTAQQYVRDITSRAVVK